MDPSGRSLSNRGFPWSLVSSYFLLHPTVEERERKIMGLQNGKAIDTGFVEMSLMETYDREGGMLLYVQFFDPLPYALVQTCDGVLCCT